MAKEAEFFEVVLLKESKILRELKDSAFGRCPHGVTILGGLSSSTMLRNYQYVKNAEEEVNNL